MSETYSICSVFILALNGLGCGAAGFLSIVDLIRTLPNEYHNENHIILVSLKDESYHRCPLSMHFIGLILLGGNNLRTNLSDEMHI